MMHSNGFVDASVAAADNRLRQLSSEPQRMKWDQVGVDQEAPHVMTIPENHLNK